MSIKDINRRVIQWVSVAERLPEKVGKYHVKGTLVANMKYGVSRIDDEVAWFNGGRFNIVNMIVTAWLDDHTPKGVRNETTI
jgi:hypothetical protein